MRKKKCVCLTLYEYTNIELKERGKKALKYFSKSQISFGSFGPPTPTSPTIQILQYSKQYNAYSFYFYPRTTHHSALIQCSFRSFCLNISNKWSIYLATRVNCQVLLSFRKCCQRATFVHLCTTCTHVCLCDGIHHRFLKIYFFFKSMRFACLLPCASSIYFLPILLTSANLQKICCFLQCYRAVFAPVCFNYAIEHALFLLLFRSTICMQMLDLMCAPARGFYATVALFYYFHGCCGWCCCCCSCFCGETMFWLANVLSIVFSDLVQK